MWLGDEVVRALRMKRRAEYMRGFMRALPLLSAAFFLGGLFLLCSGCAEVGGDVGGAGAGAAAAKTASAAKGAGARTPAADGDAVEKNPRLRERAQRVKQLSALTAGLSVLQTALPPVEPGDWRSFWKEPYQSPAQYASAFPVMITADRPALYVCRVGTFDERQQRLFALATEYLGICYQCPVRQMPDVAVERFPASARRTGEKRQMQVNSVYLTDSILKPALPADGWGVMAIAALDIFSGSGLSEQYGDTLLFGRAGVISLYNLSSPNRQVELERALKGASHEAGHLLSMPHCAQSLCNMNGRSGLKEFDRAPLTYCPACLAKLLYATGADPIKRFRELEQFSRAHEIRDVEYYIRAREIVQPASAGAPAAER